MSTQEDILETAADVLAHIAEELAFAEPGSAQGLVPLNALIMDLEELPTAALPAAFAEALVLPRRWLDAALDGTATLDAGTLQALGDWHGWAMDVLARVVIGDTPPALPSDLDTFRVQDAPAAPRVDAPTMQLNLPADLELLREFHAESLELLGSLEQAVLTLERNPTATEAVNAVFRTFHTFKGSAGFLQLDALRDLAHELESLLERVRSGALAVTPAVIEAILGGADVLAGCTHRVGAQVSGTEAPGPISVPSASVQLLIAHAVRGDAAAEPAVRTEQPSATEPAPASGGSLPARDTAVDDRFVRLDAAKLDDLVNLVGELVVAQSFVLESPDVRGSPNLALAHAVRKLSRITRGLQHNALSLRMVPVGPLFRRMTRLVRDVAAARGKQVQLVLKGEDTELDRQLVEKLADPLVHMIRNAVDHGIEPPEERVAAGKDATGTIELSAFHRHGGIVVRVSDDGRGLDPERLVAKAIDRKLLSPDARPTTQEALELVFLPGLSTADAVTDISGRGVGMDVVRGHIEALHGHVDIDSTRGAGATFSLRLPLTLALIDGLITGLGEQRFIIPALTVRKTFRPRPGQVMAVHEHGEMVEVRGQSLPVLRLGRLLARPARVSQPEEGVLLVLESGSTRVAVLVDGILGKQEVVIKTMGEAFAGQTLVSGGAILGDGTVGLILDVESLIRLPRAPAPVASLPRVRSAAP